MLPLRKAVLYKSYVKAIFAKSSGTWLSPGSYGVPLVVTGSLWQLQSYSLQLNKTAHVVSPQITQQTLERPSNPMQLPEREGEREWQ